MRLRDLDLNLLVALNALLREAHVSRAAARLDMSQSSMSLALSKLRAVFNDPLLVKGGTGLVPTARARELQPRVQEALRSIDSLLQEQEAFEPAQARDTITMIVTDYIDFLVVPALVKELARLAPHVILRIVGPNPTRFGEIFSTGEVDVSVSYFPDPPASLRVRPLFQDRLVGMARPGHPFLHGPRDIDSFCAARHVIIEPGEASIYNAAVDEALLAAGRTRQVALSKPTFLAVPFIVADTDLLAVMPEKVARGMMKFADVVVFETPLELTPIDVVLLWHDRTHTNPVQRWFRELVIHVCADLGRFSSHRPATRRT